MFLYRIKNKLVGIMALVIFSSCSIYNVQQYKSDKKNATGVITAIYKNNLGGNTIELDGKLNINVWDEDLDSTMVIGNVKSFNVKWLTRKIKKK